MDIDLTSDIANGDLDNGSQGTVAAAPPPAGTVPAQGTDAVHQNQTPPPAKEKPAKGVSLKEQLSAAFRGETGQPTDQTGASTAQDRGDGRTPTGQFAPKAGEPGGAPAGTEQPGQQPAAVQAPQGIDPQVFNSLPPETQQHVAETMARVEQQAAQYQRYDQLETVIGPRRQAWAINGVSEAQAVNQLLALSDFAGQSPPDFIAWFAGQHGVDLAALAQQGQASDQYIDPVVQELREQVNQLTGQLTHITTGQQQAQHNSLVEITAQFAAETGTDGNALRPHFAELGSGILPYINQVKAEMPHASPREVLSEAYDRACWATPSVRAKVLASQEASRLADQRATAARAQAAGSSVVGQAPAPGSTAPKVQGEGTVRDHLRAAIQQHSV
jgi:hypothetical protein